MRIISHILQQSLTAIQASGDLRAVYLAYINRVLVMAATKFEHRQTKNTDRIAWGRLMLQAIGTGHQILKTQVLDDAVARIEHLEARLTS